MFKKTMIFAHLLLASSFIFSQENQAVKKETITTKVQVNSDVTTAETKEAAKISPEQEEKIKTQKENKEFIDHHLLDAHSFDLMKFKDGSHLGFSLPIIFYDKENGVHAFMSSEFSHGKELKDAKGVEYNVVESKGAYYALYHEKIIKTDANGTLELNKKGHAENERVIDFSITKGVLSMLIVSALMLLFFGGMAKNYKNNPVPTGVGKFLEPLVLFIRDDIAKPNIGPKYRKFLGYLLTVFFFILFLNIFGLTPFGINVTGNITFTFFLALFTYLIVQISGNKDYWKHIFWMPGVSPVMKIVMIPIELIGTLTKPFALMIRLFANMTAGHIMVMSLIGLIYVYKNWVAGVSFPLLTLMIYLLEVLVAFLQAYIFTLLSSLFIGMAVQEHEHEEAHH